MTGKMILGYLRVSTEDQTKNSRKSMDDQRRAIEKAVGNVSRWFRDDGASALTAEGRPGFVSLMEYCRQHPQPNSDGEVWVYDISRFGRFTITPEFGRWEYELQKHGYTVQSVEEPSSGNEAADYVTRAVHSVHASVYSKRLSANSRRGKRSSAEQGFWQTKAPFGYRRLEIRNGVRGRTLARGERKAGDARVVLTPGPEEEQEVIRDLYTRYAAGNVTLGSLAKELAGQHLGVEWSKQIVRRMLVNPVYKGTYVGCHGEVVLEGAHTPLVDKETWHQVQDRLMLNKKHTRAIPERWALTGLIMCSECGCHYKGGGGRKGPPGDPDRYKHYICGGCVKRVRVCPKPDSTVGKRLVEGLLMQEVIKVVDTPEVQRIVAEELDNVLSTSDDSQKSDRVRLQRERDRLSKKRLRLVSAIADGAISHSDAADAINPIRQRLEEISAELDQLRFAGRRTKLLGDDKSRLMKLARDFKRTVGTLNGAAQRELIRPWLESAVIDKWERTLTLAIRQVPAVGPFLRLSGSPGRDSP